MSFRLVKNVLCSLLFVGCAYLGGRWLSEQAQTMDLALHYSITDTLTQLNAIDARWNEDLLKSRLSLNRHYDPLVEEAMVQSRLEAHLVASLASVVSGNAQVPSALQEYQAVVKIKHEQMERFKSQNSILRNSAEFISLGARTLAKTITETVSQAEMTSETFSDLERHVQELLTGLLEYTTKPQSDTAQFVEQTTDTLHDFAQLHVLPTPVHEALGVVLNHARAILRAKPLVDSLLTTIVSQPTTKRLEQLRGHYDQLYAGQLARGDLYKSTFFGYLAAVSILTVAIILRWWNRRRIELLTTANEALEQKAALSTELSNAYDELKRSQMRLVQSEKMSALGQMVAGVAHEINTPLAYSRSNVSLVQEQLAGVATLVEAAEQQATLLQDETNHAETLKAQCSMVAELAKSLQADDCLTEMHELLQASLSGLDQIADMVVNLRDFSRLDRKKIDKVNLNDGLDSALLIAKNTLKHKVDIVKHYGEIPHVTCAPSQINQVFLNMLVNASQAMDERGTITLTTRAAGEYVEVCIADDGKGIPAEALPHIFEPFFTTKTVGEGTGLGLAISYQIIEQHGGSIAVESHIGQGTCFTIRIPINLHANASLDEVPELAFA